MCNLVLYTLFENIAKEFVVDEVAIKVLKAVFSILGAIISLSNHVHLFTFVK